MGEKIPPCFPSMMGSKNGLGKEKRDQQFSREPYYNTNLIFFFQVGRTMQWNFNLTNINWVEDLNFVKTSPACQLASVSLEQTMV